LKKYDQAIQVYKHIVLLQADTEFIRGYLFHAKLKVCDWKDHDEQVKTCIQGICENKKLIMPFSALMLSGVEKLNIQIATNYAKYINGLSRKPYSKKSKPLEKITIGYYSADFHSHAISYLICELIELHNRSKFNAIAFSFGSNNQDQTRQRLMNAFDQFIDVSHQSDEAIAKLSRDFKIDIAVDLMGYTHDARPGIFEARVAPLQVNYLGYPASMGNEYIDYIIADQIVIPESNKQFYSEKVIYLPNSYQVNDRKKVISDRQISRTELGLPKDSFVFCCFNNNYKILPETFDGWMRVLTVVEGSVLWLFQDNDWVVNNLKKEAQERGVEADRLVFAKRLPLDEHLARHRQADLFLDTFPYNAHTTASDALWAGLPLLTMMGESFASRVAASLLTAIDLPELITKSQKDYEALAIELATNPAKLKAIKAKLESNRLTTPLFDTPRFTKHLEDAYTKMYERYHADLPPEHIYIEEEQS
jgi:predicted O-linked N-acetylglucosamine transferase (SPINDLY family)